MSHHATEQGVLFANLSKKAAVARFDRRQSSSDGGAVLLKACDESLGLSAGLAACLSDGRQRSKVSHTLEEMFRQRMFGIACGYADCNDAARLSDDPVMKLPAGRDPASGASLASQPTLSRFENAARRGELLRLSEALAEVGDRASPAALPGAGAADHGRPRPDGGPDPRRPAEDAVQRLPPHLVLPAADGLS